MNNKVKVAFAIGTFIILTIAGFFLVKEENDVVFYSGEVEKQKIKVYIVGEINLPGVYEIEYGTRAYEVITLAGGETDNADLSRLNLAKVVTDEEKITVPKIVVLEENIEQNDSGIVNINSANVDKLSTLNGIRKKYSKKDC